jgi:hypothetical protein
MVLVGLSFPEQFRQPRDIHGDPRRLVLCQDLGLPCLSFVIAGVKVRQRLPVGVTHDIAAGGSRLNTRETYMAY